MANQDLHKIIVLAQCAPVAFNNPVRKYIVEASDTDAAIAVVRSELYDDGGLNKYIYTTRPYDDTTDQPRARILERQV